MLEIKSFVSHRNFFLNIFKVLKKLVRRKLLYHSYSMQVHGYISLPASDDSGSFILVHGVSHNLCEIYSFNSFIYGCMPVNLFLV